MRLLLAVPLMLTAAASVAADRHHSDKPTAAQRLLEGKVAGKPQSCLPSSLASRGSFNEDGAVFYRVSRREAWKNDMNSCRFLRDDDILVTRLYGSSTPCRGDIAQVLDRQGRFPKGSCVYGDFVPYTAAPDPS